MYATLQQAMVARIREDAIKFSPGLGKGKFSCRKDSSEVTWKVSDAFAGNDWPTAQEVNDFENAMKNEGWTVTRHNCQGAMHFVTVRGFYHGDDAR